MKPTAIAFAVVLSNVTVAVHVSAQELDAQRLENEALLREFNNSGGWAYWYGDRGSDPRGKQVMVRRCNRPELRASLKPLFKMRGVEKLILHGVDFTDADLEGIDQMSDLPQLLINGEITDNGLKNLAELKSLQKLWIWQTQVNGSGLVHLQELKQLDYLYITIESMTDPCLQQLKQLQQLKILELDGASESDLRQLRKSLPNTQIND